MTSYTWTDWRGEAKSRGQISAAVAAALTAKAKLVGLWIDKADNKHQHTRRYVVRLPQLP
jgi:hypothetical protein